jgi:hypothetical protein
MINEIAPANQPTKSQGLRGSKSRASEGTAWFVV